MAGPAQSGLMPSSGQKLGPHGLKVSFDPRTQPQFWFGTAAPGPNVLIAYRDAMAELAENNRSGTKLRPPVPSVFGVPSNVATRLELGKSALVPCLVVVITNVSQSVVSLRL